MITRTRFRGTPLTCICLTLALSGCNQVMAPDTTPISAVFGSIYGSAYEYSVAETRPVSDAFVDIPAEAGQIVDVTEERHGNGVEQFLKLTGDTASLGENEIRVRMVTKNTWRKVRAEPFALQRTTARQIRSELSRAFPGTRMAISNTLSANAYGPFGYATGQLRSGARCVYAWQTLKGKGPRRVNWFARESDHPELSIRLRICRSGTTKTSLVNIMRGIRITADPASAVRDTKVAWSAAPQGNPALPAMGGRLAGYVSTPPAVVYSENEKLQPIVNNKRVAPVKRQILVETPRRKAVEPAKVFVPTPETPRSPPPPEVIAQKEAGEIRRQRRVRVIPAPSSTIAQRAARAPKVPIDKTAKHPTVPVPD